MKRGLRAQRANRGFTIVETLIVLAVTGALFVAFAGTWLGKQDATQFHTSTNDMRSRLQQMLNDVQGGYYSGDNVKCVAAGGFPSLSYVASGVRGTSSDCVFLGKIVQFNVDNTDPQQNIIYGIAGLRNVSSVTAAKPTAVTQIGGGYDPIEKFKSEYGLNFIGGKINGARYPSIATGFLSTLGPDTLGGSYTSGGQQFDLYAIGGPSANPGNEAAAAAHINSVLRGGAAPAKTVELCFKSGGTDKFALITFGQSGSQLNANLEIESSTCY